MSDTAPMAVEADVAPDIGQGETEPTPEPSYLPVDEYAGHHVRVKVDGEELSVPLREAIDGYSRQADYTRKTQELAERERAAEFAMTLQRALDNNPQATINLLSQQYGINLGGAPQSPTEGAEPDEDWYADPVEQRLSAYEQRLAHWEQQQADRELRQAIGVLQRRYGDDFDPKQVITRATEQGRLDLEGVYKEMAFERIWARQQAEAEMNRKRADEDASRTLAKSTIDMHGGSSVEGAVEPQSDEPTTVAEAYARAKKTLGL